MNRFISCDWGTSAFRLRLVDINSLEILCEFHSDEGIAATYAEWKKQESIPRPEFYTSILQRNLQLLKSQCEHPLEGLTVVLSGMASSTIGMMELPYRSIPCSPSNRELNWEQLPPTENFPHPLILIAGLRSEYDVMRGEETKLAGLGEQKGKGQELVILPGTHAKHVVMENGLIRSFKTHMTGELFNLLTTNSILSASVVKAPYGKEHEEAFLRGFSMGLEENLLHHLFRVRTNDLFKKELPEANYHYLSGLLIGEELRQYRNPTFSQTTLVSAGALEPVYKLGMETIGLKDIVVVQADEALIRGQANILRHMK